MTWEENVAQQLMHNHLCHFYYKVLLSLPLISVTLLEKLSLQKMKPRNSSLPAFYFFFLMFLFQDILYSNRICQMKAKFKIGYYTQV